MQEFTFVKKPDHSPVSFFSDITLKMCEGLNRRKKQWCTGRAQNATICVTELTFSLQHQQCKAQCDSQMKLNMCNKMYRYSEIWKFKLGIILYRVTRSIIRSKYNYGTYIYCVL